VRGLGKAAHPLLEEESMRAFRRLGTAAALGVTVAAVMASPALAATGHALRHGFGHGSHRAVFVQTDNQAGNSVVAYRRAADGALTRLASYPTGGLGGALNGSVVDHLASQGSLQLDQAAGLLLAVNAGSNTVSAFAVHGDELRGRQVIGSGGIFPVSVAARGKLVYVLNAENGGNVQGYRIESGSLDPIAGSARSLGLNPSAAPQFTNTPGQVAFTPDGRQLIVTTKANGSDLDVFQVRDSGQLGASPVVNSEPGAVPFAVTFDRSGHLVVADAGTNAIATFNLSPAGIVTEIGSVGTGQTATCWVTADRTVLFASSAGSGQVSAVGDSGGTVTLLGQTATDAGPVDSAVTPGGRFLYVQTGGAGVVDEFAVSPGGGLKQIGSVTVPGATGGEGIAAS
jgi:6-phosphogluconolactonase (cycloisomerase 2 family)